MGTKVISKVYLGKSISCLGHKYQACVTLVNTCLLLKVHIKSIEIFYGSVIYPK
jgi:hypothetical protein